MPQQSPPVTGGRVKSITSKFENLNSLEPLDISGATINKTPNKSFLFQRSATSLALVKTSKSKETSEFTDYKPRLSYCLDKAKISSKENYKPLVRQSSDPVKRSSIKRSPAFRIGEKQNKAVLTKMIESEPKEFVDPKTSELNQTGLTDTLKKALKQPLPSGPPPKKPPRIFLETPTKEISPITEEPDPLKVTPKLTQLSKVKNRTNLLNCLSCHIDTTLYDKVFESAEPNPNRISEPIYMEPYSHLATDKIPPEVPDIKLNHSSECPDCKYGNGNGGDNDLHYMCTNVCNNVDKSTTDERQLNGNHPYDEINILLNAAFHSKIRDSGVFSMANTPDRDEDEVMTVNSDSSSVRLKRSLTEKRKNYVRRVSSVHRGGFTYGKVHPVVAGPLRSAFEKTVNGEEEINELKIEPISSRIQRFKELIDTNNQITNVPSKPTIANKPNVLPQSQKEKTNGTAVPYECKANGLFEYCLLVGYNMNTEEAYIKSKYPENVEITKNIEQLIFPSRDLLYQGRDNQNYSLIFTDDDGTHLYGYCRRVLPENCEICLPLVYCVISRVKSNGFFQYVLREIESRHGLSTLQLEYVIESIQDQTFPEPGKFLLVSMSSLPQQKLLSTMNHKVSPKRMSLEANPKWLKDAQLNLAKERENEKSSGSKKSDSVNGKQEPFDLSIINRSLMNGSLPNKGWSPNDDIIIRRPTDLRLENTELCDLFRGLGADLLIDVFGSLLHERKVILYSKNISILTSSILGLQTILYPFVWQYTIVSILPDDISEIGQAPFPVIAGVLNKINYEIEDGIFVDLDAKEMVYKCGDESTILPSSLRNSLHLSLDMVDILDQGKMLTSVLISEAFLRFFVELFSCYKEKEFKKEIFLKSHPTTNVRFFLEWFVETSMFQRFVSAKYHKSFFSPHSVENNEKYYGLFNVRLLEQSANKSPTAQNLEFIIKNSKLINRKAKTLKDRFKGLLKHN